MPEFPWKKKAKPVVVETQTIVVATREIPSLIEGLEMESVMNRDVAVYTKDVYCCNCNLHHFDIAIPRGVPAAGCQVICPRCGVLGRVNDSHQVWPSNGMMGRLRNA